MVSVTRSPQGFATSYSRFLSKCRLILRRSPSIGIDVERESTPVSPTNVMPNCFPSRASWVRSFFCLRIRPTSTQTGLYSQYRPRSQLAGDAVSMKTALSNARNHGRDRNKRRAAGHHFSRMSKRLARGLLRIRRLIQIRACVKIVALTSSLLAVDSTCTNAAHRTYIER